MKKSSFAVLFALACLAGTLGTAYAAPLTAANAGHYYDADQSGQGLQLYVLPSGDVFAYVQVGMVQGYSYQASWFSVQGAQVESTDGVIVPLYAVRNVVFGQNRDPVLIPYGEVRFTPLDADNLIAQITIDARGALSFSPSSFAPITRTFNLSRLLR